MLPCESVATPATSPIGTVAGYFRASIDVNGISGAGLWAVSKAAVRRGSASVVFRMCLMRVLLFGGGRFQQQFHDAPGFNLRGQDDVGIAAIERVGDLETVLFLAGVAETAEDGAVQLHFVNLAGVLPGAGQVAVGIRIRREQVLVRTR